jgi:hypothetical protein
VPRLSDHFARGGRDEVVTDVLGLVSDALLHASTVEVVATIGTPEIGASADDVLERLATLSERATTPR